MPEAEESKLKAQATELGLTGKRFDSYVFGTLQKIEKRRTAKRKRMAAHPVKRSKHRSAHPVTPKKPQSVRRVRVRSVKKK